MDLTLPVEDLIEGEEYEFRVFAENKAGVGKPCEPIKVIAKDPFDVPGKPDRLVIANMTKDSANLTWSPPASDGGSPITNYKVEMRKKGDKSWKPVPKDEGPVTECTVPGLEEEKLYEFRVTAENKAGPGPPSDPTGAAQFGKAIISGHLTLLHLDILVGILQTTPLIAFPSIKTFKFLLNFHWNLFLKV